MHQPTFEKNANVVFKKKLKKFNVYLVEDERKPIVIGHLSDSVDPKNASNRIFCHNFIQICLKFYLNLFI